MDNQRFKVKHIYEKDYGCEERTEAVASKLIVVISDFEDNEFELLVEEKYMNENEIYENDFVEMKDDIIIKIAE